MRKFNINLNVNVNINGLKEHNNEKRNLSLGNIQMIDGNNQSTLVSGKNLSDIEVVECSESDSNIAYSKSNDNVIEDSITTGEIKI